jgi:hypothetical protein
MCKFLRYFAFVVICYAAFLASDQAQTATVIPANEAAAHLNEWATVEGVVATIFTSKSGNTFLNIGAATRTKLLPVGYHPHQQFRNLSYCRAFERKHVIITGRIENKEAKDRVGPILWRIPARVVGVGFRPEHVKDR